MIRLVDRIPELRHDLEEIANPEKASAMATYMKDRFVFLGVPSPDRKLVARPLINAVKNACEADLLDLAQALWDEPEREFHYVAADALRRGANQLSSSALPQIRFLIENNSWWDTVDALAVNTVGPMVSNHPELGRDMDQWISDKNFWVARTAILHQLKYKSDTNQSRLFDYVTQRSGDKEFFIRKALGWALREYAKTEPDAVQSFVATSEAKLSGLTRREALKHFQ